MTTPLTLMVTVFDLGFEPDGKIEGSSPGNRRGMESVLIQERPAHDRRLRNRGASDDIHNRSYSISA